MSLYCCECHPFAVRRYPQLPAQRWKNKRLRENSSLANYFVIPLSGISGNLFVLTKLLGAVKQQSRLRWFKNRTKFCSGRGLSQSTQILSGNAGITDGSLPLRCFSSQLLLDVPPWLECSPKFFFLIRHPPPPNTNVVIHISLIQNSPAVREGKKRGKDCRLHCKTFYHSLSRLFGVCVRP